MPSGFPFPSLPPPPFSPHPPLYMWGIQGKLISNLCRTVLCLLSKRTNQSHEAGTRQYGEARLAAPLALENLVALLGKEVLGE